MTFNLESLPRWLIKLVQMGLRDKGMYNSVIDGIPGPLTKLGASQFEKEQGGNGHMVGPAPVSAISQPNGDVHYVKASSFADPADVAAFKRCKAKGGTDLECFRVGDNAIGCYGDKTDGPTPMCALPPDDMIERWGSVDAAKHKKVVVTIKGKQVICILADRMPWKKNNENRAGIDLSPAAVAAFGMTPPIMVNDATWQWA